MDFFDDEEVWAEDEDDCAEESVEDVIQKIQSINNARVILKEMQIFKSIHFRNDIKKIIKKYIKEFFKNKKSYFGGKIDKKSLYNSRYINGILDYNIIESSKLVYSTLGSCEDYSLREDNDDVTRDIKLVNEALKKIYRAKIPQQFAGGFLLMYLELCKGVKVEMQ